MLKIFKFNKKERNIFTDKLISTGLVLKLPTDNPSGITCLISDECSVSKMIMSAVSGLINETLLKALSIIFY